MRWESLVSLFVEYNVIFFFDCDLTFCRSMSRPMRGDFFKANNESTEMRKVSYSTTNTSPKTS